MPFFPKPSPAAITAFLARQSQLNYSYSGIGGTRSGETPPGFDQDSNAQELGEGEEVWRLAKTAIRQWRMFPGGWAFMRPAETPIRAGETVAMITQVMGIWWLNACRIVYVLEDERQFGFAYGTLPGHVERGEELFLVECDAAGKVRYSIRAFSQPRHWLARLGYPLARAYQRKFVRDSRASMLRAISGQQ
ncbi:MAG: DUF1990 domain-containing protein [Saprospiraceae bacterium]